LTYAPWLIGSDKTIASVGTGNTTFYPLYGTSGLLHNNVRRSDPDALVLIALLPIPKGNSVHSRSLTYLILMKYSANREHHEANNYREFCRRLFHTVLTEIFSSLKEHMSEPELMLFPDGFYRWVIHEFGAYLADYPEQVLLTGVKTGWCPR
jgi:hypothetical protein